MDIDLKLNFTFSLKVRQQLSFQRKSVNIKDAYNIVESQANSIFTEAISIFV